MIGEPFASRCLMAKFHAAVALHGIFPTPDVYLW
jgi:hypothetical protein